MPINIHPAGKSSSIATPCVQSFKFFQVLASSCLLQPPPIVTMSTCGNCDCADKSQCVKKGNGFGVEIVETEKSYYDGVEMAGENDPKCKCGPGCTCTTCTCGH